MKRQSRNYNIRYENLVLRFLSIKSKDIKAISNYKFSDYNLDLIINQFVKTNELDKLVFRKDDPYHFDEDDVVIENIFTEKTGIIAGYDKGIIAKKELNDKQEVVSEESIPCINSVLISDTENLDEVFSVPLTNFTDAEKVDMLSDFNEKYLNKKCSYKYYNILNKSGYIFIETIN